jgi:Pyridoxamine 5'-phosphate oxidase
MAMAIPPDVRELLSAPRYVHLSTARADGSPRNGVLRAGLEGDHILVGTSDVTWKAENLRRDPRVAMSVLAGVRPDERCRCMDPISFQYTSAAFPGRGPDRVCFVIAGEKAARPTLGYARHPPQDGRRIGVGW